MPARRTRGPAGLGQLGRHLPGRVEVRYLGGDVVREAWDDQANRARHHVHDATRLYRFTAGVKTWHVRNIDSTLTANIGRHAAIGIASNVWLG
jgi:hypothetical protein